LLFKFFSHLQEFFKNWYTYASDWSSGSCHQKFEKNSPTGSGNIGAQSWKIWKSHGRLDPTLRMREVVHARSIKFLRVRNDRLSPGRILCEKEIFFFLIVLRDTRKVTKTKLGEFYRAICIRIYLLFSSLSDFDSFRWRVHLSYGVSGLRARGRPKTLSSRWVGLGITISIILEIRDNCRWNFRDKG